MYWVVLPPLCTILCHLWLQIQFLHVLFNTFKSCLSWPSSATFPFHLNISAGTYPLLPYHTLHVSKPTQSTSPALLTTSTTHSIPKRERKYSLLFLSENFTPHILLTIHISMRSSLLASSSISGLLHLTRILKWEQRMKNGILSWMRRIKFQTLVFISLLLQIKLL